MKLTSCLKDLLGVRHPIVQAPMLGVTTPQMAAAASNSGALGSLPIGGLAPPVATQLIQQLKQQTSNPFSVNLFCHPVPRPDQINKASLTNMLAFLEVLAAQHGHPYAAADGWARVQEGLVSYKDQLDLVLREDVPVLSFTFGLPDDDELRLLRQRGKVLMATVTSLQEALFAESKGVDVICVQGAEAGGHRGTFLDHPQFPVVGLMSLLPQVRRATSKPLLAAGGIASGAGIKAAMALGAQGAQIGSLFLLAEESAAVESYKKAVEQSTPESTQLTQAWSGRWARGIPNDFTHVVDGSGLAVPPYPLQNALTGPIREGGRARDDPNMVALWAGQSASLAQRWTTQRIIESLVGEL